MLLVGPDGAAAVQEGDRRGAGHRETPPTHAWTTRAVPLHAGALVVIATDGLPEQPGGPRGRALGWTAAANLVARQSGASAAAAVDALERALRAWEGAEPRRDDVTMFAFATPEPRP